MAYVYPLYVNNPFGEVKGDRVTHVLDYMPSITLEGGKVYNLSGFVFNPLSAEGICWQTRRGRAHR